LPSGVGIGSMGLDVRDFGLNARSSSFKNLFGQIQLNISDFSLDQDSVVILGKKLLIQDQMSTWGFLGWEANVQQEKQSILTSLDTLLIEDLEIDSVLVGKFGTFEKAIFINPSVNFEASSGASGGTLDLGIEKEIIISGGKVEGILDSTAVSLSGLDADIFVGDSTAFRSMDIEDISISSRELNHALTVDRWMYDTLESRMHFEGLQVTPIAKDRSDMNLYNVRVPNMQITEFEQSKFFDEKHFYADSLKLTTAFFEVINKKRDSVASTSQTNQEDLTFNIHTIAISDADLSLKNVSQSLDSLEIMGVNTTISDLDYPQKGLFDNGILYSDFVQLEVENLFPYLQNGDSLTLGKVIYSSDSSDFSFNSINYSDVGGTRKIEIPNLIVKSLDLKKLVQSTSFKLDSIIFENPSIYIQQGEQSQKQVFTKDIDVNYLGITHMSLIADEMSNTKRYQLPDLDVSINRMFSKDTLTLSALFESIDGLSVHSGAFVLPLDDSYNLDFGNINFQHPQNELEIDQLHIHSSLSALDYSKRLDFQNDWFDVSADKVRVADFDLSELVEAEKYTPSQVSIEGLDALIYRDKEVPFPQDQVRDLPQSMLRDLVTKFQVDTIELSGRIRYQEKPDDYDDYGEISFDQSQIQLINASNIDSRENAVMILNGTGFLMGSGRFQVNGTFDLNSPSNTFSLSGQVIDFPLDSMNRMLGPVANVNIKSGYAKELDFNFQADNDRARGEMRFRYNDLKVQILNVKTHDTQGFGQGIKTFFANTFVVKNKNPSYLVFLRRGTIFNERDTSRAIFNYWGKSLLSGVVSSIGVHKSDKAEKRFDRTQAQSKQTNEN
ncbi:MAG: hypothetical protein HRT61_07975, partial [Ekhidna sp.]|nr:hypothetical protein [Ekhidna sp.]